MSESYATIRYAVSHDRVATVTLDRPEMLNAFDRTRTDAPIGMAEVDRDALPRRAPRLW